MLTSWSEIPNSFRGVHCIVTFTVVILKSKRHKVSYWRKFLQHQLFAFLGDLKNFVVRQKWKSWKIKWLGFDKFSTIAKLSCCENVLQYKGILTTYQLPSQVYDLSPCKRLAVLHEVALLVSCWDVPGSTRTCLLIAPWTGKEDSLQTFPSPGLQWQHCLFLSSQTRPSLLRLHQQPLRDHWGEFPSKA